MSYISLTIKQGQCPICLDQKTTEEMFDFCHPTCKKCTAAWRRVHSDKDFVPCLVCRADIPTAKIDEACKKEISELPAPEVAIQPNLLCCIDPRDPLKALHLCMVTTLPLISVPFFYFGAAASDSSSKIYYSLASITAAISLALCVREWVRARNRQIRENP